MSEENVEIVRRAFEALARGGTDALLEYIHPEFEATTPPGLAAEPDTYRGHDGVRRYFESFSEAMEDIRFDGRRFEEIGDRVVVEMTLKARGRATGIEVGQPGFQVWELRDMRAIRLQVFGTRDEALKAAGLSE